MLFSPILIIATLSIPRKKSVALFYNDNIYNIYIYNFIRTIHTTRWTLNSKSTKKRNFYPRMSFDSIFSLSFILSLPFFIHFWPFQREYLFINSVRLARRTLSVPRLRALVRKNSISLGKCFLFRQIILFSNFMVKHARTKFAFLLQALGIER